MDFAVAFLPGMALWAARTTLMIGLMVQIGCSESFTTGALSVFNVLAFFGKHSSSSSDTVLLLLSGSSPKQELPFN